MAEHSRNLNWLDIEPEDYSEWKNEFSYDINNVIPNVRVYGPGLFSSKIGSIGAFMVEADTHMRSDFSAEIRGTDGADSIHFEIIPGVGYRCQFIAHTPGDYRIMIAIHHQNLPDIQVTVEDNDEYVKSLKESTCCLMQRNQSNSLKNRRWIEHMLEEINEEELDRMEEINGPEFVDSYINIARHAREAIIKMRSSLRMLRRLPFVGRIENDNDSGPSHPQERFPPPPRPPSETCTPNTPFCESGNSIYKVCDVTPLQYDSPPDNLNLPNGTSSQPYELITPNLSGSSNNLTAEERPTRVLSPPCNSSVPTRKRTRSDDGSLPPPKRSKVENVQNMDDGSLPPPKRSKVDNVQNMDDGSLPPPKRSKVDYVQNMDTETDSFEDFLPSRLSNSITCPRKKRKSEMQALGNPPAITISTTRGIFSPYSFRNVKRKCYKY